MKNQKTILDMSTYSITIKHNKKIKKFSVRRNFSVEDFIYLLNTTFSIKGKILTLQESDGII